MRTPHDDVDDIRELIEHAAASWRGPGPLARQARWTAEAARRQRVRRVRLAAAGLAGAALVLGSATAVSASRSPSGPAASVVRLVSQVLAGPPPGTPLPAPATASSPALPAVGLATPSVPAPATPRAAPRSSPSPTRSADGEDHRTSPRPSASPSASSSPSPSPSRPPDE